MASASGESSGLESDRLEAIGAELIGGLRPFFLAAAVVTILLVGYAAVAASPLNIWLGLIFPTLGGILAVIIYRVVS